MSGFRLLCLPTHLRIYMINSVPCRAVPSVCLLPDVWGHGAVSPLTSMSQWKGQGAPAVGSEAEQQVQEQRTAAVRVLGRLGGYKTPLEQPCQARCQADSSGDSGWPPSDRYAPAGPGN